MIGVGPARGDFPPSLAEARGAFVWWYVDLVDRSGNGAVLLWSFGLPFLPGRRDSRPRNRPALNLAVYENGRAAFYLLQELDPARCEWDGAGRWSLEDTRIERQDGGNRVRIDADLRLSIPNGGSAVGELQLEGPLRTGGGDDRDPLHSWEPVSVGATASLALDCGGRVLAVTGSGYHDRNGGNAPLAAQGLSTWRWARLALPTKHLVVYWMEPRERSAAPKTLVFEVDPSGQLSEHVVHAVSFRGWRLGPFGGWWPRTIALDTTLGDVVLDQGPPVDEGPFYRRHLIRGRLGQDEGVGFSEHVRIARLDRPLHRPFVNMRVHSTRGPNSFWLPLFSGPREGRIGRLLGSAGR